jgi:hypothetical protein
MTGAVAVAALTGLLSLVAGVALGWRLRRANEWCTDCGRQMGCETCRQAADLPSARSALRP